MLLREFQKYRAKINVRESNRTLVKLIKVIGPDLSFGLEYLLGSSLWPKPNNKRGPFGYFRERAKGVSAQGYKGVDHVKMSWLVT